MIAKPYFRSFAGGEITPEMFGRLDLTKNQTGLARALNFQVLAHGPAVNRAGFQFVAEARHSGKKAVLIPFIFSTEQAYALEFGDQYLRIHTNGGVVLNTAQNVTGVTQADPGVLTYSGADPAEGATVYLAALGGMTELNGRFVKAVNVNTGANTFEIADLAGEGIDTTGYGAYTSGGAMSPVYEVATPYLEADLPALHYTQSNDVMTIVHPAYQQRELKRLGATNWTLTAFALAPTIAAPAIPTVAASGSSGVTYTYVVTAVAADGLEESVASPSEDADNNLATPGAYNTITPAAVTGAVRYNVYKLVSGLYGYIGQTDGSDFKDDNITPDFSKTPPLVDDPFVGVNNYPAAVTYYGGRRWFGGTRTKPQSLWATRPGTESNLSYSIPVQDDDRIAVRFTARQANSVNHLVPLGDLLAFTSGAEWKVDSGGDVGAVTAKNIDYRPQGYIGASYVQPVVTSRSVLYAQARGGRMREMQFKWESQGYDTNDISLMAPHLFDGYEIVSIAYAHAPHQTLWCVRDDGVLLGCTYVPEHQVVAWHQHTTDGTFESVCAVPEGNEDVVYAVVKRTLLGRVTRTVERLHSRLFRAIAECFFVDCGATYSGAPTTTISGLWHLVGKTVCILRDGAVEPQQVVAANGTITLAAAGSTVHVGLPYVSDLETLPMALEAQAFAQGIKKNVNRVYMRVHQSSGVFAGPSFDKLRQVKQRTTEPYGSPPNLINGVVGVVVAPSWDFDAPICVRQADPLPLTLSALIPEVAV